MTYHKLQRKLEKLEKKNKGFTVIAISKFMTICSDNGSKYIKDNITKIPRIYKLAKETVDYNPLAKQIIEIIGE